MNRFQILLAGGWMSLALWVLPILCVQAQTQVPEVNLQLRQVSLRRALQQLEAQTGYRFFYAEHPDLDQPVDGDFRNLPLDQVLRALLLRTSFDFQLREQRVALVRRTAKPAVGSTLPLAAPARIAGRVVDGATGEPLPGASVQVVGTATGTMTQLDGSFQLLNLPGAEVTLQVSYLGYRPQTETVVLQGQDTPLLTIRMAETAVTLEGVTVQAVVQGQQKALNQQRTADNIKNVVSADLISRFPDLNVAEALQRVPGVTINRERGEGTTVQIRGTPAHFTAININGEQIPSVEAEGVRNESLDLIPADVLSSMEVVKALTPDMDGDAIGGSVNLRQATATTVGWRLKAEAGAGYNDMSTGWNGIGRLTVGRRFLPSEDLPLGRMGVLVNASYFASDNTQDISEAIWRPQRFFNRPEPYDTLTLEDFRYRDLDSDRERLGLAGTFDFRFSPTSELVLNVMYSSRTDREVRRRLRFDLQEGQYLTPTFVRNAEVLRDVDDRITEKSNLTLNLTGQHALGQTVLDYGAFYTTSTRTSSSLRAAFNRRLVDIEVQGLGTDFPVFFAPNVTGSVHDPLLLNNLFRFEDDDRRNTGENWVGKANLTVPARWFGTQTTLKFGVKYRRIDNQRNRNNLVYDFIDPTGRVNEAELFARLISDYEDRRYMQNNVRFGPSIDIGKLYDFFNQNRDLFRLNLDDTRRITDADLFGATEQVYAAYGMARMQWQRLMILTGVRVEQTEVDYRANIVETEGFVWEGTTPIRGGTGYTFWLPNLHVRYRLDSLTNLRFSAVSSYARANFQDIVPFQNIDLDGSQLQLGNPDLKPTAAIANLDLLIERYFSNVGVVSAGVFFKQLDDFNFNRVVILTPENYRSFVSDTAYIGFRYLQPQNGNTATVFGAEINLQAQLDFLPGVLSGLGLYLNYTYTGSDAFTNDRSGIRLPGQAEHFGNAALSYERGGFSCRVSLNYIGGYTSALSDTEQNDFYREARYQLDVLANYRLNDHWSLFAEGLNVTNTPIVDFQGNRQQVTRLEYFGWWNRFGVSYRF